MLESLILVDPKEEMVEEWKKIFSPHKNVSYHCGRFEELISFDCIINAGNSYGLMDGGVDEAISNYYGWGLQDRVQAYIRKEYHGEQPVGTSFLISTVPCDSLPCVNFPYLAHTPTMRAPSIIRNTDNVYHAFRAALIEIGKFNRSRNQKIKTAVCMGMGTRTGGVSPEKAAKQMYVAYKDLLAPPLKATWPAVKRRELEFHTRLNGHCLDYLVGVK